MFKIFRKLYFKFYHLLKFLGIFILIFGLKNNVYAEEYNTCFDEYKIGTVSFNFVSVQWQRIISPEIPISSLDDTYYVRFFSQNPFNTPDDMNRFFNTFIMYVQPDNTSIGADTRYMSFDVVNQVLTFQPRNFNQVANTRGVLLTIASGSPSNYTNLDGATVIVSKNLDDVLTCKSQPPVPGNNVFSDFLTIYTDRISYLANGSTENPYLLAMVGIIFAWVVLELFLHIFHLRGGYKK